MSGDLNDDHASLKFFAAEDGAGLFKSINLDFL